MRRPAILALLVLLAAAVLALAPLVGAGGLGPAGLWEGEPVARRIFWSLRVPRVLLGLLAGMALAAGGMAFQALLRNPLATPFTLGVSGGAALGATLAIRLGWVFALFGVPAVTLLAFLGALLAAAVVLGVGARVRDGSVATLLLAGVAVSFTCSSLILLIHYSSDMAGSFNIVRWLMGHLDVVGGAVPARLAPVVLVGVLLVVSQHRELDLLSLGDELAAGRGVAVRRARWLLLVVVSLMTAAVVAACGPIGFVGMMVPHIGRLLVGPSHRWLAPVSLLLGGTLLVACDAVARVAAAPAELPVGVVTALLGGPFFLWLLLDRRAAGGAR